MKKLLITLLVALPFISFSQIIDEIDIRTIKSEYIEIEFKGISAYYGLLVPVKINYDFGKKINVYRKKTNVMYDGSKVNLKTSNDFINFFTSYGFELIDEVDNSTPFGTINNGTGFVGGAKEKILRFKNNNN